MPVYSQSAWQFRCKNIKNAKKMIYDIATYLESVKNSKSKSANDVTVNTKAHLN